MSLLTELVSVLSKDEREQLASMPVRGKQAAILHAVIAHPGSEERMHAEASKLGVSASHLYAIQSNLLERCYQTLIPAGGFDLLAMLAARGLTVHYRKVLHAMEREIQADGVSTASRHEFYSRLLHLMICGSGTSFQDNTFAAALAFWKRTISHPTIAHDLMLAIYEINGELQAFVTDAERQMGTPPAQNWLPRLDILRQRIAHAPTPAAKYYLCYAYSVYYASIEPSSSKLENFNAELLALVDELPPQLSGGERKKLELRSASLAFARTDYGVAYQKYLEQWRLHGAQLFILYSFHLSRFLRAALETGEYGQAEEIIEQALPAYQLSEPSPIAAAGSMYKAFIFLLRDELESARQLIRRAEQQNSGWAYNLSTDVLLRFLEIFLELFSNSENEYVLKLVERTIKHLSRKGMTLKSGDDQVYGFYAMKDVVTGCEDSELVHDVLAHRLGAQPALGILMRRAIEKEARRSRRASSK